MVKWLCSAVAEGRLTLEEADERQKAAYAACFPSELSGLTADLPQPPPNTERRNAHELWRKCSPVALIAVDLGALVLGMVFLPHAGYAVAAVLVALNVLAALVDRPFRRHAT